MSCFGVREPETIAGSGTPDLARERAAFQCILKAVQEVALAAAKEKTEKK